jgi:hypothetical protein
MTKHKEPYKYDGVVCKLCGRKFVSTTVYSTHLPCSGTGQEEDKQDDSEDERRSPFGYL